MRIIFLFLLGIGLYGCPYESTIPLAPSPTEAVDTSLLGYWYGIVKDGSDFFGVEALDIKQESDSVYAITRYGKAVKGDIILPDTSYFTGYISSIGSRRFMNVKGSVVFTTFKTKGKGKKIPEVTVQEVFYISHFSKSNDTLTVKTIAEKFSPSRKPFNHPDELKAEVHALLEKEQDIYDEVFSLSYRKMDRPPPPPVSF